MKSLTWVEINKRALIHNIDTIRSYTQVPVMHIIKSNAYGHGLSQVAKIMTEHNVTIIGVQSVYELNIVRSAGFAGRLILIGPFDVDDLPEIALFNAEVVIYDIAILHDLESYAQSRDTSFTFHLKVETGLHRQGLGTHHIDEFCTQFLQTELLIFRGVTTHFASIENTKDYSFSQKQFTILEQAHARCVALLSIDIEIHAANSGATLLYPEFHGSMVRAGIINYGLYPSPELKFLCEKDNRELQPVLSWKTRIAHLHIMKSGETLGYGRTYVADSDKVIALLPVGYYDGYMRNMRDGQVLINGTVCPVVGSICMNMMMCDVTHLSDVEAGNIVTLIGGVGPVSAQSVAKHAGTIHYEITTIINDRIPRVIV